LGLLEHHGTWELADVLDYAIDYADNGHPILARAAGTIEKVSELFTEHWPSSAAHWMPEGRAPVAGEPLFNRPYADVLRRLIAAGAGADTRADRASAGRPPLPCRAAPPRRPRCGRGPACRPGPLGAPALDVGLRRRGDRRLPRHRAPAFDRGRSRRSDGSRGHLRLRSRFRRPRH